MKIKLRWSKMKNKVIYDINSRSKRNGTISTSEEFDRATNAYRAAIDLRKLGSDQVRSRLSAILTANTIIIAVSGLAITSQTKISSNLIVALIGGGLILCLV
jgi:hypothetical protein